MEECRVEVTAECWDAEGSPADYEDQLAAAVVNDGRKPTLSAAPAEPRTEKETTDKSEPSPTEPTPEPRWWQMKKWNFLSGAGPEPEPEPLNLEPEPEPGPEPNKPCT